MLRKAIYSVTILNIIFQIIYMTFGNLSKKWYIYFFYIFRVEYMLLSGVICFVDVDNHVNNKKHYERNKIFLFI